jgi:serine protease AprX
VAVTQVSAVAAQMFQAAPQLTGQEAKELLLATALPLPQDAAAMTGHRILQPTRALAAALRTHHRVAQHFPASGTLLRAGELQRWVRQGKLNAADFAATLTDADVQPVYFGIYWPGARRVSVVGAWNGWQPACQLLQPQSDGWWHSIIRLPTGRHLYRFWLEDATTSAPPWQPDPENPVRCESGYRQDHSVIFVG